MHENIVLTLINLVKAKLREGDQINAKRVAQYLIDEHPETLEGWLFMAGLSLNDEDRFNYLSRAKQIDAEDPRLIKALAWANQERQLVLADTAPITVRKEKLKTLPVIQTQLAQSVVTQHRDLPTRKRWQNWLYLSFSILLGTVGIGLLILLFIWYGPRRPQTTISEDTLERFQITPDLINTDIPTPIPSPTSYTPTPASEGTHTPLPTPSPTSSPTPTLSPTPEWMTYDDISFRDQGLEVLFTMACNQDQVFMEEFFVRNYTPELLDSGEFNTNLDFAMAWEHLGFYGLWIHSGISNRLGELPAYPLQIYLENNPQGLLRGPSETIEHMQDCLLGSEVILRQGETLSANRVVAAVRIPPFEVEEVSLQPMNLVPYLAENYPDSGFDQMELPGLLFYFCGRQLRGETYNTSLDYWTQSRFIIGIMPVDSQ